MQRLLDLDADTLRRERTSMKWATFPDLLPLWVAEMDARPCPPVVEALTAAVQRGDFGYPTYDAYRQAFADHAAEHWDWEVNTGRIDVVADVMTGVVECIRRVTREGGPVIISSPAYNCFYSDIFSVGRRLVDAPLGDDGRLDFEVLERTFARERLRDEPTAYLLCNPHNPTGTCHTRAELEQLRELAFRYGVRVISDEIHAPLVYAPHRFVPYLTVDPAGVAVFSPAKGWNLAAVKSALVVTADGQHSFPRLPQMVAESSSHLGVMAHTVALREGQPWLEQLMGELDENRRLLADLLADRLPAVGYRLPEATYLAWLDLRGLGLGDDPASVLRERAGVALSNGINYGPETGRGFARLNLATSPAIITEAIERIAAAVA